jgi:hypothetical protein
MVLRKRERKRWRTETTFVPYNILHVYVRASYGVSRVFFSRERFTPLWLKP